MKLRNKKTGEIIDFDSITDLCFGSKIQLQATDIHDKPAYIYNSLAELNEEWEDYEEPKDYYLINLWGEVSVEGGKYQRPGLSELGLTFETKEEAEKVVEKLKAWKRLRDKGFRFKTWYGGSKNIDWEITSLENETYIPRQICDDLDLLFGGKE